MVLLTLQGVAAVVLLWRLLPALRRAPPVPPHTDPITDTTVSVVVPTLNEARRLAPCLAGLSTQGRPLTEVLVVDSGSADGTRELVAQFAANDSRIRLAPDPPLPPDWIGKVWALQHGLSQASGEWVLGMDADTEPGDNLVPAVVAAARARGLQLVSFSPLFSAQTAGERWLQPALLVSLVYRTGAPGASTSPDRLLANGQCFLVRRETLLAHGGYGVARDSFADDVRMARHYARLGVRCAFLDGRRLYRVRSYRSAGEMWREWGRSVDLADATSGVRQFGDLLTLVLAQALPVPLLGFALFVPIPAALILVNLFLLSIRFAVLAAIAPSYERRGPPFYASWLADPAAVLRVALSTFRRPMTWRGRSYRSPRVA